jgi:hypothetical protein
VLKVTHVSVLAGRLYIYVANVSPHAIERGVGAFDHQSLEQGKACLVFSGGKDGKDLTTEDSLAAQWFAPYASMAEAAKFGNTASGVFVQQVKAGMSFAEVESALGLPQTRVDLGQKVLYKYKDMTVEFQDGKVSDVR